MNVVAYSEAVTLPVPVRAFSRVGAEIEHKNRFTPGIPIKVILEAGNEHEALLRWAD